MTVANLTGRPKPTCAYCANDGLVVVDTGDPVDPEWLARVRGMPIPERQRRKLHRIHYAERVAPCPKCEFGLLIEFPTPDPKTHEPRVGSWGPEGFWRGRPPIELVPVETGPPTKVGSVERIRELTARLVGQIGQQQERKAA